MHISTSFAAPLSPHSISPSLASSEASYQHSDDEFLSSMGANTQPNTDVQIDGIGVLNYQRAIDIARNTEGELDQTVSAYLETAIADIWNRINLQPESYVMTSDEFAVFNFHRGRFSGNVAEHAVARYWANTHGEPSAST